MDALYHGSQKSGLEEIKPEESGHGEDYVYAVPEKVFAAIFINSEGGSLVAEWGRLEDRTPFYCEMKEGILDENYSGVEGSIYKVSPEHFKNEEEVWGEEWVSETTVPVLEEERINDIKQYLQKLQEDGKLKIVRYENRMDLFPKPHEFLIEKAMKLAEKYGVEITKKAVKKHRPDLLDEISEKLQQN